MMWDVRLAREKEGIVATAISDIARQQGKDKVHPMGISLNLQGNRNKFPEKSNQSRRTTQVTVIPEWGGEPAKPSKRKRFNHTGSGKETGGLPFQNNGWRGKIL